MTRFRFDLLSHLICRERRVIGRAARVGRGLFCVDEKMKFSILIILFWWNPLDDDGRGHLISHEGGRPLFFKSEAACVDHVKENYNGLKKYIEKYYSGKATISEVRCVRKTKQ